MTNFLGELNNDFTICW